MSTPLLPSSAVSAITDDVIRFGRQGLETGAFLLADPNQPARIASVALLGTAGIDRRRDQLVISGLALARLFDWADEAGLVVRVQLHSHLFEALMSPTDERFGLTVEGFISAIVPDSAAPSREPEDWGWWRFSSGRWVPTDPAHVTTEVIPTVCVDERGVDG